MDRRETVEVFRQRLLELIERSGLSRSGFATRAGLDRSTLSQLLAPNTTRLPRAETIAALAQSEQVSVDWLLGLSQEGRPGGRLIPESLEIEPGAGSPDDARLVRWHAEAVGYKVRYIPSTLPDLLKSELVIRYEYRDHGAAVPETRLEQAEARLAYSRQPETDMEVCSSLQALEVMARGQGIWNKLPKAERLAQIERMILLVDELYPTFRWFLFDGLRKYATPLTIFGPKRAALYIGSMYLVVNATAHIRALTAHFDDLIRSALVQPTDVVPLLGHLADEMRNE